MTQPESLTKIVDLCGDERIRVIPMYTLSGCPTLKQYLAVELPDSLTPDLDNYILEIAASLRNLSEAIVRRYGSEVLNAKLDEMLRARR